MLLPNTCLNEFLQPVAVCPASVTVTTALTMLGQGDHDHLVLVDQQRPIGVIRLNRLLPFALPAELQQRTSSSDDPLKRFAIELSIMESLTLLPGTLPLRDFLPYLHAQPQPHYGLLDEAGALSGLLDTLRLLKFITASLLEPAATNRPTQPPPALAVTQTKQSSLKPKKATGSGAASASGLPNTRRGRSAAEPVGQRATQGQGHSSPDRSLYFDRPTAASSASPAQTSLLPHLTAVSPLVELLERLPLPLMLQTGQGEVLTQNTLWRGQVGELLDPGWVRQEAAALLEAPLEASTARDSRAAEQPSTKETASPSQPLASLSANLPALTAAYSLEALTAGISSASVSAGRCQPGAQPNACVCACPLKNGQERVLQFVKIPIGQLSLLLQPDLTATVSHSTPGSEVQWQDAPERDRLAGFRLARLLPLREGETGTALPTISPSEDPARSPWAGAAAVSTPASETLWLVLAQDITEQRQLARELTAKNADLVQLNRLKDEFLACISHELRTPLTAVLGLSSLLKDQTLGELNQRQARYAQLIYRSGRHLMAVVNDILDLTRMETGQLDLAPEPVEIVVVCNRAFEQAKQLRLLDNTQEGVSEGTAQFPAFLLEVEPGLERLVADELRLRQMLIHLLSNALKFTEAAQPVGLKVGYWGGWIAFTVWDGGIGIPADKQHLIFQKFQQAESPLTRRFEGTGLGLVLTQRLARLHGGDVTFISKEGQGSQFTILLPPSPPASQQATSHGAEPFPAEFSTKYPGGRVPLQAPSQSGAFQTVANGSRLVLIVEAVPQYIETLSDQLTGLGYRVVIARSGTEALEKARRLQPCIIFLNPVLPLLAGWDVLTLLKSSPETCQIPVAMTATKVDEEQAYRSHADDVVSLPVQAMQIKRSLRQLVIEAQGPELCTNPRVPLTVLRLGLGIDASPDHPAPTIDLNQLLHSHHYRVLEADDLEQAELLARVWKPNVVLLDGTPLDRIAYFEQFSQHTFLASLPLVTLDQETTQVANQVLGLLVFPCLAMLEVTRSADDDSETSTLLQVIQIAAGYAWRPSILTVDAAALPMAIEADHDLTTSTAGLDNFPQETEWLQALTQYLQTAGFRSLVGRSWQEVQQQIQSQSIDLLLICWTESDPQPDTLKMVSELQQLKPRPPVIVLDHRHRQHSQSRSSKKLPTALKQIATQVVPPSLSMAELLHQIHQAIKDSP